MEHWPHAPSHCVTAPGAYIVTCGTYLKRKVFNSDDQLTFLEKTVLTVFSEQGWLVQQWAVFPNHYHVVALSPENGPNLRRVTGKIHSLSAIQANKWESSPGRKVWHQYWDSHITFEKSYLARLNYVRCNAVHHGLVQKPEDYRWCSANWFERESVKSFFETVASFRYDRVSVEDDY